MSAGPPESSPLPIIGIARSQKALLSPPRRWLVRLARAALLVAAVMLLRTAGMQARLADQPGLSLEVAAEFFPNAARLLPPESPDRGMRVVDAGGLVLGEVISTSPAADHVIGYSGPAHVLLGLNPAGEIIGVRLLSSRDTIEHVDAVRQAPSFWSQLMGWNPLREPLKKIEAVSGSTLTSLGIVEAIETRLGADAGSLRFPQQVSIEEVQALIPRATTLSQLTLRPGWIEALDRDGQRQGWILRTSPSAETVRGYSGPTEALIALDGEGRQVTGVRLRSSFDTPEYVDRVRGDDEFLQKLAGRALTDYAALDFQKSGIEGVSGATQTSYAVAEGVRRRLTTELESPRGSPALLKARDWGLLGIVLGGMAVTFVPALSGRRVRVLWQVVLVAAFGLWLGDMLSIALVAGWSRNGIAWRTAPGLVTLTAAALIVPWGTRRQVYCHALCPHGAVQEWLGSARRLQLKIPRRLSLLLGVVPGVLLATGFIAALFWPRFDLTRLEPFDAWVLGPAAAISMAIAIGGLLASMLIPQAYCRFGCPTGALLKLVRSHGTAERWGRRDWLAAAAVGLAAGWIYWPARAEPGRAAQPAGPTILTGRAFGTTWTVKIRDPLAAPRVLETQLAALLESIESRLSHWRAASETSQFNASETTLEVDCSRELADLVMQARKLSESTDGRFDITVGPLVDAWGFGPSGPKPSPPDNATIERLLASVGSSRIEVDPSLPSIRKTDPAVQMDLGALLQGFAVDQMHDTLQQQGFRDFLIEIGGELRSAGVWRVGLDPAAGAWTIGSLELRDQALSTSGVYRQSPAGSPGARHIISPTTGRPEETPWKAVAVLAPTCREADGWDTALLVSPNAADLAQQRQLTVQLISPDGRCVVIGNDWKAAADLEPKPAR